MVTEKLLYVVGMMYIDSQNFEPEAITGTQEKARQWINEKMEGYQYNGIGYYTIREIPYVG